MDERLKTLAETMKKTEGTYPTKNRVGVLRAQMEACETPKTMSMDEFETLENNVPVDSGTARLVEVEYKTESQRMYERLDRLEKETTENTRRIDKLRKQCSYLLSTNGNWDSGGDYPK